MKLRVSSINLLAGKNKEKGLERKLVKRNYYKIVFKQTMWRVYRRTRKDETMQITKRYLT